ncbi:MAG: hypothetical protein AAF170_19515, partial [Bacteroidota bacterium]
LVHPPGRSLLGEAGGRPAQGPSGLLPPVPARLPIDPATPDALAGWGNASTTHQVVRNGLVVGGWRRKLYRDRVEVRVALQAPFSGAAQVALEAEAEAFGQFLGLPVTLDVDLQSVT